MHLFAEKLVPYNAAYITLSTGNDNLTMQRAATAAGYFFLNETGNWFTDFVTLAKPLPPLVAGGLLSVPDIGQKRRRAIDPFDTDSFRA